MKIFRGLLIAILAFSALAIQAQDKLLSIDDIYDLQLRIPFSGRPLALRGWTKDGRAYKVFQNGELLRVDASSGESSPVYDTKKMVSVLSQTQGFTLDEANRIGQAAFQQLNASETAILINHNKDLWFYDLSAGTVKRLTNTM